MDKFIAGVVSGVVGLFIFANIFAPDKWVTMSAVKSGWAVDRNGAIYIVSPAKVEKAPRP